MTKTNAATLPIIRSERLTLRSLFIEDSEAIYELRSDATINKFLDRQPCKSLEDAENFINNINKNIEKGGTYYWAITLTDTKQLAGTVCLFDFSSEKKCCEIGYELSTKFQGQGIMQEAVKRVIDFAFEKLKLNKILAFTHSENEQSSKLLLKLNFVKATENVIENPNLTMYISTK
jgi:ribosomal-protein-alanine N-acetyltransferase